MQAGMESRSLDSPPTEESQPAGEEEDSNLGDEERGFGLRARPSSISPQEENPAPVPVEESDVQTRPSSIYSSTAYIRRQTGRLLEAIKPSQPRNDGIVPRKLQELINSFRDSDIHQRLVAEVDEVASTPAAAANGNGTAELPDVAVESRITRGRKRASWGTQFRILSGRAFKNLYRDPALLFAHYIASIGVASESISFLSTRAWSSFPHAVICGFFFQNITNDIAGFQNRLGMFFFTLALFGFSCLSSLTLFANERILFMRERSVSPPSYAHRPLLTPQTIVQTATIRPSRTSPPRSCSTSCPSASCRLLSLVASSTAGLVSSLRLRSSGSSCSPSSSST